MAKKTDSGSVKRPKSKLDFATIGGLAIAVLAILGGLLLEGGHVRDISQATAALIVIGGTLGAVMVSCPMSVIVRAAKESGNLFQEPANDLESLIEEIVGYSARTRKYGIVSLENEAGQIADPFLNKALNLAIDGTDLQEIRSILELESGLQESREEAVAKVFESAGGYAPTIGIIGAVMGLIQVMKHLEDINEVGHGIAVAFVATVYGVGAANIVLLPAAGKIRSRIQSALHHRDLITEGVIGIVEGLNPKLLRRKLDSFKDTSKKKPGQKTAEAAISSEAA